MRSLLALALSLAGCPAAPDSAVDTDETDPSIPDGCGDGLVDGSELCDDGALNGTTACGCTSACAWPVAGVTCDDSDPCTADDACDVAGACVGPADPCDDGDACTVDTCAPDGACASDPVGGAGPDLYELDALLDPSTLDVQVLSTERTLVGLRAVDVHELRYTSVESDGCVQAPIRVEAYLAVPVGASGVPGLVVAHGLGGHAEPQHAAKPAGSLGAVVLAYSGPGQGASEGVGSGPDHLFDTVDDPRDSWFWEHAAAAMRGLTLLEARPEVDPERLAMSGYSGGGVATYMVNGTDPRVKAAMPVSAVGHLDLAASTTPVPGWEVDLLAAMDPPRDPSSPEWQAYVASLDPKRFLATAHAPTLIVNGAQDQFFPIHATEATARDLAAAGPDHRLLVIPNWDHGWFALFNGEQALADGDDAFRWWMRYHLDLGGPRIPAEPSAPTLTPTLCASVFPCTRVSAQIPAPSGVRVDSAQVWWSLDALTWFSWNLQRGSGAEWAADVGTLDPTSVSAANAVFLVMARYSSGGDALALTSRPLVPPGFQPTILPIDGPFPSGAAGAAGLRRARGASTG
jgi:dienelactone hydrolase